MNYIYLDIEGNDLYPQVNEIYCVVTRWNDTVPLVWTDHHGYPYVAGNLRELKEYLQSEDGILVAHNGFGYDFPVIHKFLGIECNGIDTLTLARLLYPSQAILEYDSTKYAKVLPKNLWGSHSLEAWGYRLGVHKTDFHDFSQFSTEMVEYCIDDVSTLITLHQHLLQVQKDRGVPDTVVQLEMQVAEIIQEQMWNGVCFDEEAALQLDQMLRVDRSSIALELQQVFPPRIETMKTPAYYEALDGQQFPTIKLGLQAGYIRNELTAGPLRTREHLFNPGSRTQIADRLKEKYDWDCPLTDKGNPSIDDSVLEELKFPEAKLLHRYMVLNKRLGQLSDGAAALRSSVQPDGKIYGYVNTNGTRTHRMAHSKPNLGQIPAVYSDYGTEFRSLFTASEGKVLVGIDASGLEGRFKGHYLFPYDKGAFVDLILGDADLHTRNAEILDLDRTTAKTWYYAWLFGAGPEKLAAITGRTVAIETKYKQQFLDEWPELAQLLKYVQDNYDSLIGLDGRPLLNDSEHTALNTLIQSAGAILMKVALVLFHKELSDRYYKRQWDFVLNVHDEWQLECDPEIAEDVGKLGVECITKAGELLNVKCPMTGEYKVGKTWAETH